MVLPALFFAGTPLKSKLGFRENKGQVAFADGQSAPQVLFKTTGTAPGIFITTSGITYVFSQREGKPDANGENRNPVNWSKVEMLLDGASIKSENIKTEGALPGVANFYYAHCPNGVLGVKTWQHVTIANVYPGIDWILNADDEKGLSYDFIVHPGADASKINVLYKGAKSISTHGDNNSGSITLRSKYGEITEGALNVFEKGGKKVEASFKIKGTQVSYSIGAYDPNQDLIIDPPLQWSQKEISSGLDYGNALVAPRDGSGDAIITGFTGASDFPTLNAYQGTNAGNDDICVLRLSGNGTMLWSTYYGGSDYEGGKGIGADVAGNCYVAGYTASTDFPTLNALYSTMQGGNSDLAILKLNNSGVRQWATYYGGVAYDYGNAVVCDQAGNMYITGYTNSGNFPLSGAIQPTKNNVFDIFVMKLNSSAAVQWATFYGSDDDDRGRGITLDPAGANVYVTGTTIGAWPYTTGAFQVGNGSIYNVEDGFVLKMNASTAAVQYSTLCGGTDTDIPEDIAVDNQGNAYITGYTFSNDYWVFNPGGGAYVDSTIGSMSTHDVFITKVNPAGSALTWSTYMGGSGVDMGLGICFDPFYGIYVTGATASTDFPTHLPLDNVYYQNTQGDGGNFYDMFVAWFTTAGVLEWSTYYGDANSNEGRGIDTDAQSNIFVCGADSNNIRVLKFNPGTLTGVAAASSSNVSFKLYPVPAQSTLTLQTELKKEGTLRVEILNEEGRVIKREILNGVSGANTFTTDISALPVGNYVLRFADSERESASKFVKVK